MNIDIEGRTRTGQEDKPLTREDVEQLLREAGSSDKLDLSGRNLREIDLSGFDLAGVNLSKSKLIHANLSHTNLSHANLSDADLSGADLSGAFLYRANLTQANLSNADLHSADLSGADVSRAFLYRAYLKQADLSATNLSETNLSETSLGHTNLSHANLSGAILRGTNLAFTDLRHTNLRGVDLHSATVLGAKLRKTILSQEQIEQLIGTHSFSIDETETAPVEGTATLLVRIVEEPLTLNDLTTILSALTELITELWLISKGRFTDLIEYSETHNVRFAQEAGITITEANYNSPFTIGFSIADSAKGIAEAIVMVLDGIVQVKLRYKKTELELDQKRIEYTLESVRKTVDLLYPNADEAKKEGIMQALLPNILQIQSNKAMVLALPMPQNDAEQSAKPDNEKKP